jgi:hypothetical protein
MLCVNYYTWAGEFKSNVFGLHWGDLGIIMHDQVMIDNWWYSLSACRRTVALHEYGHHINIIDRHPNGDERYCINLQCAMATAQLLNIRSYPFYCAHHWSEHRWPGW